MTEPTGQPESAMNRFPLSGTQQWLCGADLGDEAGAFGRLFTSEMAVRIPGQVNVEALRCALDDVVRRHEMLRTIVVRDARPRYQQVYPPAPATLEVRDLPPASEKPNVARIFALPSDQPFSGVHTRPYSAYYFSIDAGVAAEIARLSAAMRSSVFMILLAAFNVLTYEINGTTDPVIHTFSNGRNE